MGLRTTFPFELKKVEEQLMYLKSLKIKYLSKPLLIKKGDCSETHRMGS